MARKAAWHSTKSDVHHVCTNCNTGNNIETGDRQAGAGGKPLCLECSGLISRGDGC